MPEHSHATEIYVDADACPVKQEVLRVAERHGLVVHMVSNGGVWLGQHPLVRHVMVPATPDAVDDWIAARIRPGDIAVTADVRLAARCLEAGARALGPGGRPFDAAGIGMAVATRDLMARLRETGVVRGGGPPFSKADRARFLDALEAAVRAERHREADH
jgi:uncharacterized protein YaiI (UPF0178 family)